MERTHIKREDFNFDGIKFQEGERMFTNEEEATMIYHRYTHDLNPLSEWGHALFTENEEEVKNNYGPHHWVVDSEDCTPIENFEDLIKSEWIKCQETEDFGNHLNPDDYATDMSADEVINSFNPPHIVNSADAWDSEELLMWFWEFIGEPEEVKAVSTQDGAVVFDPSLCQLVN